MGHWWNDTDRRKLKCPVSNLSHCNFVHDILHSLVQKGTWPMTADGGCGG